MKDVLAAVEQRGPALVQQLDAAAPELLGAIRAATKTEWLPQDVGFGMVHALDHAIGRAETRAIYLDSCLASFRSGTLGPLFNVAVRIFGPSPHLVAKWLPPAWVAVWRGCGELLVEEARPGFIRVRHLRVPREATFDAFLDVAAECIGSVISGCKKTGHATVERRDGEDPIRYVLRWKDQP